MLNGDADWAIPGVPCGTGDEADSNCPKSCPCGAPCPNIGVCCGCGVIGEVLPKVKVLYGWLVAPNGAAALCDG